MPLSNKRPLPPFLKRVNFKVLNKCPSRSSPKKEKEMMLVMKMQCLYPLEVYNFELRFSQNVIKHGYISLSFLAACRIALSPFSQTRSDFSRDSSIGTCPTKSFFFFSKFVHFEIILILIKCPSRINAPLKFWIFK